MVLLLIEDEVKLTDALCHILNRNGYVVDIALDGEMGLEMAETGSYDLIILDRMLPKCDGLTVLKKLRCQNISTPVIFLTAKDTPKDKVEGLDSGADDYLIKPFSTDELLARLRALTRRKDKVLASNDIKTTEFTFNPFYGEVMKDGQNIKLTVKESLLLQLLLKNDGQVLTKDQIVEKVWGYNSDIEFGNVDLYIHYLRKKLNTACIKTIRGVGYSFREDSNVS